MVNLLVYIFCFLFHCTSVIFTIRSFTELENGALSTIPYSYSLLTLMAVTWLIVAFLIYYTIRAGGTAYQIGITYSVFLILVSLDFFNAVAANPMRMAVILFAIAIISFTSLITAIAASGSAQPLSFSNIRNRLRNFLRNRKSRKKKAEAESPSDTGLNSSGAENLDYDAELPEIKFSVPLLKSIFVPLGKIASSVETDEDRLKTSMEDIIRDFRVPDNIRGYVQDLFEDGCSLSPSSAFLNISNSALEQYGSSLKYRIMKIAADILKKADPERQKELFILLAKAYRIEQKDTERLFEKYLGNTEKPANDA